MPSAHDEPETPPSIPIPTSTSTPLLQSEPGLTTDTWDGRQQRHSSLLGLELTGYRLITTSVILGLGIHKAVCARNGQSLISPTLDWFGGMIFAIILFWLGEIGANRPKLFPLFFRTDLAPPILKFLRRREVMGWFISALPLLSTMKQVQAVLDVRLDDRQAGGIPAHLIKDRFTVVVTAFSIAVSLFCSQFLSIVWQRWLPAHHGLLWTIYVVICAGYCVSLLTPYSHHLESDIFASLTHVMAYLNMVCIHLHVVTYDHFHDPESIRLYRIRLVSDTTGLIMNLQPVVFIIGAEVKMQINGFHDIPGGLYRLSFACCMAGFLSRRVPFLSRAWRRLKVTYDRIWRGGRRHHA